MLLDFIIIILLGLVGGILARKINQPTVVGYLLAGFLGSFFIRSNLKNTETINFIAQLGISMLLFTLGIELSLSRINKVLKIAVIGGILQIIITTIVCQLFLRLFGLDFFPALFLACCFSLSSTAVVVKILNEKVMLETIPGEILVAWLLIQDLAVIPLLILLPIFKNGLKGDLLVALLPFLKVFVLLFLVIFLGKKIASKVAYLAASLNNKEILLLASISLCFLTAFLTQLAGLSFVLGAFLGGVIIAETLENHAMLSEIRPLRDLFSVVFFVSLPLLIDPQTIIKSFLIALFISALVIFVKFVVVILISLYFGYHSKISFLVAMGLVQVGEFAFILANDGLRNHLISVENYSLIISVTIITILLTPFLFNLAPVFYESLQRAIKKKYPKFHFLFVNRFDQNLPLRETIFENHVILCGFGRMGRYIGRALELSQIPYLVIEIDRFLVAQLRKNGVHVIYGDPADKNILSFAGIEKAKILVLAIPDFQAQKAVITHAKTLNQEIKIISRTHFEDYQKIFKVLGADIVVHPEFSASLEVIKKVFKIFGVEQQTAEGRLARLKIEHGL